jgi:hypothetical protein
VHQLHHHFRVVVDALEQHCLAAERYTGSRQAIERGDRRRSQLARVIEVRVHEDRMVLLDHLAELRRDTLRQVRGDPASDTNDLDVRDRAKLLEDVLQPPVAQHHGISAAQNHVADLGVLTEIRERRIELIERNLFRIADLATPRAEPAIGGAHRADEKQRAVRIPVRDVRHWRIAILIEGVDDAVDDVELLHGRDVLIPHRIAHFLDLLESSGSDSHLEVVECRLQRLDVDDVVAELFRQLLQTRDALILDDLLPIAHACTTPAP